ncbi:MAG: lamin tail domain-containing protein [Bacteroidota bacterium]
MKKTLLLSVVALLLNVSLSAQCTELFISEYVEGYANNKAIEIYNPTDQVIDLSQYSLVRFRNGQTNPEPERYVQLPDDDIQPYDVYVIVIDQRDTSLWDSQFDKPAWNGFNLIDTLRDFITMEPLTDSLGNFLFGPQYQDGNALFGNEYNEEYDLQCKADAFLCPTFEESNAMYFNGNDAVALIQGTVLSPTGDNLIDVIGVIGEDPELTIGEPAWVDANGFWVTRDRSIVRRPEVTEGRNAPTEVIAQAGGSFMGEEWISYRKDNFSYLGVHTCDCASGQQFDRFSCSTGPIASTFELSQVNFQIFPNPNATGNLTITAEAKIERVDLFNVVGQQLGGERFGGDVEQVNLDISELQRGIYLIHVVFEGRQLAIQKLVVE